MKRKLNHILFIPTLLSFSLNAFAVGGGAHRMGPVPVPPDKNPGGPKAPPKAPIDTNRAEQAGRSEGGSQGENEGRARGPEEGFHDGLEEGYKKGYGHCEHEASERAMDEGFAQGHQVGMSEGYVEGQNRGNLSGQQKGEYNGSADGLARADADGRANAQGPASAKGYDDAENPQPGQPNARQQGKVEGTSLGDQQAQSRALSFDYPRARQAYSDERYADSILFQDSFSQKSSQASAQAPGASPKSRRNFVALSADGGHASPDFRFLRPNPHFGSQAENDAYTSAYRSGYVSGFESAYNQSFSPRFEAGKHEGEERGCHEARNKDYSDFRRRGFVRGKRAGYDQVFQQAFSVAEASAYNPAFSAASQRSYGYTYPGKYDQYFQSIRAASYQTHFGELNTQAREAARSATYNQFYPGYAQAQANRGRADETADFESRPVRFIDAEITDTNQNGVFEPGERLHLSVKLRNFSDQPLSGRDVNFVLEPMDDAAVVATSRESLVKDLRQRSLTEVKNALDFQMIESSVGVRHDLKLTVFYQGREVGHQVLSLVPKFIVDTQFLADSALKEGLPMPLRFKMTNVSQAVLEKGSVVQLKVNKSEVELQNSATVLAPLNPGESTVVEFIAIARTSADVANLPFALSVTHMTGRRIGLLDMSGQVPVNNDYRIQVTNDVTGLTEAGVTRAKYKIKNISARLMQKGIQLHVRLIGANAANFTIIGPNPQFLFPLAPGTYETFVVPILSQQRNCGDILELEVHEDGRPVVIHRLAFSPSRQKLLK